MRIRSLVLAGSVAVLAWGGVAPAAAQQRDSVMVVAAGRSMVTRAELQTALERLQRGLTSTGYSAALRSAKQSEADLIRDRLAEGDLRPGDQIKVEMEDEKDLSRTYTITPARTLVLPAGVEISMRGVLRSEVQDFLTKEFKRYIVNPVVTATTYVRISMFGALNKPGFFAAPASTLLSQEIMTDGGGPQNNVRWEKSTIKRGDRVIVPGDAFDEAVRQGLTLDQLNVQAGDRIDLAAKPATGLFLRILGVATGLGGLIYLFRVTR